MKISKTSNIEKTKQNSTRNQYDNALAVMSNTLARAKTRWNAEETKLMLLAVSQFSKRNSQDEITLNKADLMDKLGYGNHYQELRKMAKSMMHKAIIELDGPTPDQWRDGFLFVSTKATRKDLIIRFNNEYNDLLQELTSHFTELYIDNLMGLNSKHSLALYMYLSSWFNPQVLEQHTELYKNDLQRIFNLEPNDYWRNYGSDKAKFDWGNFEKRCLYNAIDEINNSRQCDIKIVNCIKLKKHAMVTGYEIIWGPINPNTRKWAFTDLMEYQMSIEDYM